MEMDNPSPKPPIQASRPYRSHKFPACDFCRRRKSRCVRSLDNRKCVLCQMHGAECTQEGLSNSNRYVRPRRSVNQRRNDAGRDSVQQSLPTASSVSNPDEELHTANIMSRRNTDSVQYATDGLDESLTATSVEGRSGHIVGPVSAHDVQVLDQYMSPSTSSPKMTRKTQPYSVYSTDPTNPILYLRVPRRRESPATGNGAAGYAQCEAISKVLEPHCNSVFDL